MSTVETSRLSAARAGEQHAFDELVEPYRRELQTHCYRILGSLQDAEDLVQETLLRAWRRLDTFEGRGSFRAWLYKIATNACLDALDNRPRRSLPPQSVPPSDPSIAYAAPTHELLWFEPFPDEWLSPVEYSPESLYTAKESITLAFLTALQLLAPRQRAVLILRDVFNWQASEVAEMLDFTISAVNNALHRARMTINQHYERSDIFQSDDDLIRARLNDFVRAWESADIEALVTMLKEDAVASMPPSPSWYAGREAIVHFLAAQIFPDGRRDLWRLVPIRANGQPAFGGYFLDDVTGIYEARVIQVLIFEGNQIAHAIHFMSPSLFECFGLPKRLSS